MDQKNFLDIVSKTYKMEGSSYTAKKREQAFNIFSKFIWPKSNFFGLTALQLGCADGYETELIAKYFDKLDVVDGSKLFIDNCMKKGFKNVTFINELFEDYIPKIKYDYVFATYVLEHVLDVTLIFDMIKRVLNKDGFLFIIVPNARAFSRQLALHMGLITGLKNLTPNDIDHGHKRVYDFFDLNQVLNTNGFDIIIQGGILFKLLADFQMDTLLDSGFLTQEHIDGLMNMGNEYPEFADSIYAVCRIKC